MRIETERLILRKPDPKLDLEPWTKAMTDPETVRYLATTLVSPADAWRSLALALGHWSIRGFGSFSLQHKETGAWIGRVGPWQPEGWPGKEVGWVIAPQYLRQGYATEAARASVDYAFNVLGWQQVIHIISEGNEASIAVARKLGSELLREQNGIEGVTEDRVFIYGQDKA